MELVWHDTDTDIAKSLERIVQDDLRRNMEEDPSGLIFHHVFLTRDMDGPCVFVWGEKGSNAFHCEYHEKTEWKTLAEIEAEERSSTSASDDATL